MATAGPTPPPGHWSWCNNGAVYDARRPLRPSWSPQSRHDSRATFAPIRDGEYPALRSVPSGSDVYTPILVIELLGGLFLVATGAPRDERNRNPPHSHQN